jgi:hypothetical protein
MNSQNKQDLVAGGAILFMFLGAYTLIVSRLGLLMLASGVIVMLFLFLKTFRTKQ